MGKLKVELMEDLHEYQKLINTYFTPGELKTIYAARNVGKSVFSQMNRPAELIFGEGPIHGARYFTIQPVNCDWPAMERWCYDTFGEPASVWANHDFIWPECGRWYMNNAKFWFRNQKDRDWFVMKWSAV